jgi:hypothetical protein
MRGGEVVASIMLIDKAEWYELSLIDFVEITQEEGIESVIELIHKEALKEFMSRSVHSMWDWELRTKNMFINNHLYRIGDVAGLPVGKVNRLMGCGYTTKKEVYDVFYLHHLKLKFWNPDVPYTKMNYKF